MEAFCEVFLRKTQRLAQQPHVRTWPDDANGTQCCIFYAVRVLPPLDVSFCGRSDLREV